MTEPLTLPQSLGRYRLIERIAVGGMAEIYRATLASSHGIEKTVVIKRILPHLAREPEFVSMFIDEARLMVQLAHPKIVQVLEFGETDGNLFMAMELVEGVDALALLRACARQNTRLPVPLAMFIASEILDALEYAHTAVGTDGTALQVVHRDISPSNIFIQKRGYVKLADFGIARVADGARSSKTQGTTLKGKYGYMAPEQVVGAPLDGRVDVFAVGIVLTEMLIGRRLFSAPNDLDVLLMVREANIERLDRYGSDLAPEVRAILDLALQRSPAARYASAGAFRRAILDWGFRNQYRIESADLAKFLESVMSDQPMAPGAEAPDAVLDGPSTKAARAQAASLHRAVRAAVLSPAVVEKAAALGDTTKSFEHAVRPTPSTRSWKADITGDLIFTTPARLIARLASDLETGLLLLDKGAVSKEVFLVRGEPEFVASNVTKERFGEYLVENHVISAGELSMVLAVMPSFNGKLGDTLVGLGLMRPLEVFRNLSKQVRIILTEAFSWTEGRFCYFRGRLNTREAFPLRLDLFEILGAAVAGLPLEVVRERLLEAATARVQRLERMRPTPADFCLGSGPGQLWEQLDGRRTVADWMREYRDPAEHLTLCRTLYLLIETGLATLE
ncbi:MAG: serine/threonine protein kinase [Myxococcales bacterium]|nr:serine/threonine protein kinase [Myxococcales bacterium]